jgi:hypothetical protein
MPPDIVENQPTASGTVSIGPTIGRKVLQATYLAAHMPERDDGHHDRKDAGSMINLVPASPAVPAAAAKQNHNDDDD